jgi:uncharacterized protein YggE
VKYPKLKIEVEAETLEQVDQALAAEINQVLTLLPDGGLIARVSTNLIRLRADGSRDPSFAAAVDWNVTEAFVQPDGRLVK